MNNTVVEIYNDASCKPVVINGISENIWDGMIIYRDVNGNRTIGTFPPYSTFKQIVEVLNQRGFRLQ